VSTFLETLSSRLVQPGHRFAFSFRMPQSNVQGSGVVRLLLLDNEIAMHADSGGTDFAKWGTSTSVARTGTTPVILLPGPS
jgi:hypothetical protein